ncbi:McrB family protein [Priestia megaterium]|uniref:McrB family protein n=1 Tax=Priestia megaterium TaxID=1404 RepID=UPI00203B3B2A|nr:AAA family ATPase [Priestia megaterium]MCM3186380.1 AAA family ATPase [Priestia megaterium]
MFWTLDRVVNLTKARLDMLITVLSEFEENYDRIAIYQKLIDLNYVKNPSIEDGKTKKEVYEKKWGSYVGPLTAYGIAKIQDGNIIFSELAKEYQEEKVSFEKYVETVMLRWQLPNGGLTSAKADEYIKAGILVKPFLLVLQVLLALHRVNRFEAWIDPYDINEHLLKAKNNDEQTVNEVVQAILNDRKAGIPRKSTDFKLDVVFNTFCATGIIAKNQVPSYMPPKTSYSLAIENPYDIQKTLEKNVSAKFTNISDMKNKDKWMAYYGGSINNADTSQYDRKEEEEKQSNIFDAQNIILFGSPGTGKSYELDRRFQENVMRVTFHPEYTYHDFIGSYRPVPIYRTVSKDVEMKDYTGAPFTLGEPLINYQFVPGPFTLILEKALVNPDKLHTFIIEEINRANASAVFGDLFQLLDRNESGESTYSIIHPEIASYLKLNNDIHLASTDEIRIPYNLNIVATMNSSDQGVAVLDSAFKRRWNFEYLPIDFADVKHAEEKVFYENSYVTWKNFVETINDLLSRSNVNEDKLIGPYFMKKGEPMNKDLIASKLLIYLWDDVVRTRRTVVFRADIRTFSQLVKEYVQGNAIFNCDFQFVNPIVLVDDSIPEEADGIDEQD